VALLRRTVTPRMATANRRNARLSTGPRTLRGKAQSSLNALRHGRRSAILKDYSRLWSQAFCADPRATHPRLKFSELPLPPSPTRRGDRYCRELMEECTRAVAPYVRPWPRAVRQEDSRESLLKRRRRQKRENEREKECLFSTVEAVK
jgi:hypothetical protein